MTTSTVILINPDADFEEQMEAVRGLLLLVSDGVRAMDNCVTPATQQAIYSINAAVVEWVDDNLKYELKARAATSRADVTWRGRGPVLAAAE